MREKLCRSLTLTRYTDSTMVDCATLLKLLAETRRRGWAKTNEKYVKGVSAARSPSFPLTDS